MKDCIKCQKEFAPQDINDAGRCWQCENTWQNYQNRLAETPFAFRKADLYEDFKDTPHIINAIERFCNIWIFGTTPKDKDKFSVLFIYGKTGRGKTHVLWAIRHLLLHKERSSCYLKAADYISKLRGMNQFSESAEQAYYRETRHNSKWTLLFDDLSCEIDDKNSRQEIENLIDHRHEWGLPTIITSNLPLRLKAQGDNKVKSPIAERYSPRLMGRIGAGYHVLFGGDNYRIKNQGEKIEAKEETP